MNARRNMQHHSAMLWRAVRRWVALAIGVAPAICILVHGPAQAQQLLACGVPVSHHLDSGSTDAYQVVEPSGPQVIVDVTDTSGTLGLLKLTALDTCQDISPPPPYCLQTCDGSLAFPTRHVAVSDCVGSDAGTYAIEFNIVQQTPENCGVPLSCGVTPADTALSVPGEVDSYTFAGVAGQQISLTTTATSDTGDLRLRLFSPQGDLQSDSCTGALTYAVPSTGTYTVLVSACVTPSTGPYTIVWQTLPVCPAAAAAAFAYVTYSNSGTVGVIDLTTNQTVSLVPALLPPNFRGDNFSAISASPNNGFVYVSFFDGNGTVSVINTTLNRLIGSINLPGRYGALAFDPEGRYAYGTTDLPGVSVIDVANRKIAAVISYPDGNTGYGGSMAVSPDGKFLYVGATFEPQPGERRCIGGSAPGSECTSNRDCPGIGVFGGVCEQVSQNELIVIDTVSRTVVGRVTDPRFGSGGFLDISFNPTAALAYVTSGGALWVIDTASKSITRNLPASVWAIAYSRDGRVAYALGCAGAGCASFALLVIDMPSLAITNTIPLEAALEGFTGGVGGMALSPDGGRLLLTNPDATAHGPQPAVVVIDTVTLQVASTIAAVGDEPLGVVIVTPPTGLCIADGSGQTRVTVGELVSSVDYSVDGCPTARTNRPASP